MQQKNVFIYGIAKNLMVYNYCRCFILMLRVKFGSTRRRKQAHKEEKLMNTLD